MDLRKPLKTRLAFWVWRNLAGGMINFYNNPTLWRHKAYMEPINASRFRRWLWRTCLGYLVRQGELTQTPTLRDKF